uniref:Protein Vpu n=1 Tax=Human immunodeficiency virus type 1 TaxID=11676 RepID=Q2NMR2_HV1|nr:vpu protein [Human immunodeficiency virus 1]
MQSVVLAILAIVLAIILAIVVWSIVFIEYRKILTQRRIDRLIDRIRERAEDSGNDSEGDHEQLSALVEMGHHAHHAPWDIVDLYCCRKIVGHSLLWGTCVERSKHHSILCIRC